jgi:WD domain, G-beta repeat
VNDYEILEVKKFGTLVRDVTFSPDGKSFITAGDSIRIWDTETRKEVGQFTTGTGFNNFERLSFSRDGKLLVAISTLNIYVWDTISRQLLIQYQINDIATNTNSFSLSPDGKIISSSGYNGLIYFWDISLETFQRRACEIANRELSVSEWLEYLGTQFNQFSTCTIFLSESKGNFLSPPKQSKITPTIVPNSKSPTVESKTFSYRTWTSEDKTFSFSIPSDWEEFGYTGYLNFYPPKSRSQAEILIQYISLNNSNNANISSMEALATEMMKKQFGGVISAEENRILVGVQTKIFTLLSNRQYLKFAVFFKSGRFWGVGLQGDQNFFQIYEPVFEQLLSTLQIK